MQQSLENAISRLQKIYQLKSLELENIYEELELRRIATALANFKDSDELSTYDIEKIKTFLVKSYSTLNIDSVVLSSTIVGMASNAVKASKRYAEASAILAEVKSEAIAYIVSKDDLFLKQTQCENLLKTMEKLFYVLTNKVIVDAESLDVYVKVLEREVFQEDKYAVLVVVAALVIRNANLLAGPDKVAYASEEIGTVGYVLSDGQQEKRLKYLSFLKSEEQLYGEKHKGMVTGTYLKNIEVLIEKKKIDFEEAKVMLNSDSQLYEYFLWNWMNKLVARLDSAMSESDADSIIHQLDGLKEQYDSIVDRKQIKEAVQAKVKGTKKMLYPTSTEYASIFNVKEMNGETVELIDQLRNDKVEDKDSIISLDNELSLFTGKTDFVLFKNLPNDHIIVLLFGKIDDMNDKLEPQLLAMLSAPNYFDGIKKVIFENGAEYKKLIQESEKIESKFPKKEA